MKTLASVLCWCAVFSVLALVVGGVAGCAGMSAEQQARVDSLVAENATLALKLAELTKKAKEGTVTPEEITKAMEEVQASIVKNKEEIAKIQSEGTTTAAWVGGLAGALGRTVLHGATKIPLPGPLGMIVQMAAALLLGGSATTKKEEPAQAIPPVKAL